MRKSRKRLSKKGRWIIFLLIIALPFFYLSRRVIILIKSIQEEHNLKKQILILEAKNEISRNRINEYKRGTLLEAKARDDLGMIKKGEKVYLILKK